MTDAQGTVIALEGDEAVVRMDEAGCGRCHEKGGCGGQNLGRMFCSTSPTYRLHNPGGLRVGGPRPGGGAPPAGGGGPPPGL